jgi:hypothetical protein
MQTGQSCPVTCTTCMPELENTVLQWALKLNSAPAAAETWCLKRHTLQATNKYM